MPGPDEGALRQVLLTTARCAGVTINDTDLPRLTSVLGRLMGDWQTLTRAVIPEVEPMAVGRWPDVEPPSSSAERGA